LSSIGSPRRSGLRRHRQIIGSFSEVTRFETPPWHSLQIEGTAGLAESHGCILLSLAMAIMMYTFAVASSLKWSTTPTPSRITNVLSDWRSISCGITGELYTSTRHQPSADVGRHPCFNPLPVATLVLFSISLVGLFVFSPLLRVLTMERDRWTHPRYRLCRCIYRRLASPA
jgi:hypothetical protein